MTLLTIFCCAQSLCGVQCGVDTDESACPSPGARSEMSLWVEYLACLVFSDHTASTPRAPPAHPAALPRLWCGMKWNMWKCHNVEDTCWETRGIWRCLQHSAQVNSAVLLNVVSHKQRHAPQLFNRVSNVCRAKRHTSQQIWIKCLNGKAFKWNFHVQVALNNIKCTLISNTARQFGGQHSTACKGL